MRSSVATPIHIRESGLISSLPISFLSTTSGGRDGWESNRIWQGHSHDWFRWTTLHDREAHTHCLNCLFRGSNGIETVSNLRYIHFIFFQIWYFGKGIKVQTGKIISTKRDFVFFIFYWEFVGFLKIDKNKIIERTTTKTFPFASWRFSSLEFWKLDYHWSVFQF